MALTNQQAYDQQYAAWNRKLERLVAEAEAEAVFSARMAKVVAIMAHEADFRTWKSLAFGNPGFANLPWDGKTKFIGGLDDAPDSTAT